MKSSGSIFRRSTFKFTHALRGREAARRAALLQHNKVPALEIKFPALLRRESLRRRLERRGKRAAWRGQREEGEGEGKA